MTLPFARRDAQPDRVIRRDNPPAHDARILTEGGCEAHILLDGTLYVLRITRLGKLILTK